MFKVIDGDGVIHDAYGTFIDADGDIQFILCDRNGNFYQTSYMRGFIKLYTGNT